MLTISTINLNWAWFYNNINELVNRSKSQAFKDHQKKSKVSYHYLAAVKIEEEIPPSRALLDQTPVSWDDLPIRKKIKN